MEMESAPVTLTKHAVERAAQRGVSPDMVRHAMEHGRSWFEPMQRCWYFSAKWGKGRVNVVTDASRRVVITVHYRPISKKLTPGEIRASRETAHAD